MTATLTATKWCPQCERWLARDAFWRDALRGDRLSQYCRECKRAYNRASYHKHYTPKERGPYESGVLPGAQQLAAAVLERGVMDACGIGIDASNETPAERAAYRARVTAQGRDWLGSVDAGDWVDLAFTDRTLAAQALARLDALARGA